MDVTRESLAETQRRLLRVIGQAELEVYGEPYAFEEMPLDKFPSRADGAALGCVRDDDVWSQLVPVKRNGASERFRVFRFHFPDGVDNSGFVGWLATHLKRRLGTGVFVLCGHNSGRGGIFDYWGCPWEVGTQVLDAVQELQKLGRET